MRWLTLLLLVGTAWAQAPTGIQTQGPLTVQGQGGEQPSVSATLESHWDPRTRIQWKAFLQPEQPVLELHVSRDLTQELEAALHLSHEVRNATRVDAGLKWHGWQLGVSQSDRGRTELRLACARVALSVGTEAGELDAAAGTRVLTRGWFTVKGSADELEAGYRYRKGSLSVGARARRTWYEAGTVDSVESDLFYRW